MSSSDGMPVEVIKLEADPGTTRVPMGMGFCFVDLRLKEDMASGYGSHVHAKD